MKEITLKTKGNFQIDYKVKKPTRLQFRYMGRQLYNVTLEQAIKEMDDIKCRVGMIDFELSYPDDNETLIIAENDFEIMTLKTWYVKF